jgi:signal transduction histidine kinase/ActR/RegA family two-component response regulator
MELGERDWEFVELLDEDHRDEMRVAMEIPTSSPGAGVSLETVGKRKNGGKIYLDMRAIQITYEGAPALEAILGDVTEQKHVHDQVVSSERLRALGEMAGGVAHDFNNVLGAILGRAQLLQRQDLNEEIAKGLRIIEKAAQDGSATVQRIQEFSRVRTDQEFAPIDLGPMLEDVIEMTRSRWEDEAQRIGKTVTVKRDLDKVSPVDGNISELRELFMNFILNAVDAIEVEGVITVGTDESDEGVLVTITDNGHGMSPEVQRKLFDPFFTTKGSGGVGLGMSIAYGTIQRHGGDVEVSSTEGSGTTFTISFPFSTRRGDDDTDLGGLFAGAGRILVVDDEEDVRELVKDILIEGGYEVETASGGAEALDMIGENNYELVITDLGMPGVGGWDVARGCRDISPETAVALLTGWGATVDSADTSDLGIERVLKKPFEMLELLAAVQEILGKRGLAESA